MHDVLVLIERLGVCEIFLDAFRKRDTVLSAPVACTVSLNGLKYC